jgi:DNA-binding MarR family transcriptional regulator
MGSYSEQWGFAQSAFGESRLISDAEAIERANRLTGLNRSMTAQLGEGFFDNPAQMMLLELFIARIKERATTVKVLALSSGVPTSTAQRWIDRMVHHGIIMKQMNSKDHRSLFVTIEDQAFAKVRNLLARLGE